MPQLFWENSKETNEENLEIITEEFMVNHAKLMHDIDIISIFYLGTLCNIVVARNYDQIPMLS